MTRCVCFRQTYVSGTAVKKGGEQLRSDSLTAPIYIPMHRGPLTYTIMQSLMRLEIRFVIWMNLPLRRTQATWSTTIHLYGRATINTLNTVPLAVHLQMYGGYAFGPSYHQQDY